MLKSIVRQLSAVGLAFFMAMGIAIALPGAALALNLSTFQQTSTVFLAETATTAEVAPPVETTEVATETVAKDAEEVAKADQKAAEEAEETAEEEAKEAAKAEKKKAKEAAKAEKKKAKEAAKAEKKKAKELAKAEKKKAKEATKATPTAEEEE